VRGGERPIYRFLESFSQKGKWIYPDIGYIDFGRSAEYREIFVGGGRELFKLKRFGPLNDVDVKVIEEFYINSSTGSKSGALYFLPWTFFSFKVSPMNFEGVYFPYVPLDGEGKVQHVVERVKAEYYIGFLKFGVGYGAYQVKDGPWQDRPFVTATLKTRRFGDLELWLQRFKDGKQLQVRYFKKI